MTDHGRTLWILGPLLLALLGLWCFARAVAETGRALAIQATFAEVPGELLDCGLETRVFWRPLGRREERHEARAFYAYEWDGVEYEGTALSPYGLVGLPDSNAYQRSLLEGLRIGADIPVFVDPERPERSFLRVDVDPWLAGSGIGVTGAFALVSSAILLACRLRASGRRIPLGLIAGLSALVAGVSFSAAGTRLWQLGDSPKVALFGMLTLLTALVLVVRARPWLPGPATRRSCLTDRVPGPRSRA